ncbi:MAG: nitroreductase family protein [Candidatus Altiarchaeum hamiconexum]|uniref:Nitroreductase family protein n=1 Tax=Candidatus Altarchaeum hamiconexum TaxID=1803513 RepID=A0A8J7Z4S0_9ARCH|nr:nitroreductase family protein [Candidatus Altarchaeum hamiconexum]PIV28573.1 MAG: nitroreductase family protein [Candidatus Altarchaeum sp. CG03_land_8_20_14_0_80_32_618]PJC13934.1 MAG: nitroreductase family protein [Candidatus Altarchaeum sp. CG_4_9_14_0_8_um_filter_32_206]NCN69290.1 nitroreductase family protein [Candidatus Altarchaeum hamiconexum]NCS91995.1 nitroreductase family protein [Candidatus Altarchaeum hamiconexum]
MCQKVKTDIENLIKSRRSIRKFKNLDVEEEKVLKILESGRWSPSGLNNQPWRFCVLKAGKKDKISKFTSYWNIITESNVCICVFMDSNMCYDRTKDMLAIGACIQNMLLTAENLNLGTCWLGEILKNKEKLNEVLNIDKSRYELVAVIAVGYKDESPVSEREVLNKLILRRQ